jgi:hypothetical protein
VAGPGEDSIKINALVFLEKALCWGDVDLIAGKRKVNLIFNIIDHYEAITTDFANPRSRYLPLLEKTLWWRNTQGNETLFEPGLVQGVFWNSFLKITVKTLFDRIRHNARIAFPDDYLGRGFPIVDSEIRRRSMWLKTCIFNAAQPELEKKGVAGCLSRAVTEVHEAEFDADVLSPAGDHSYGHYTIPWHNDVLSLNRELRKLALAEATWLKIDG